MGWHWLISVSLAVLAFFALGGGGVGALVGFLVFALYWLGVAVFVFDLSWLNPFD
jgi:hypothetical protein